MRYTDEQILADMISAIKDAGGTREFARQCGLSPAFVSMAARGITPPGPTIANHLGYVEDGKRWVRVDGK